MFPEAIFQGPSNDKKVYLTFDDGPHPEATNYVLDVLGAHSVKATFFLLGKNVLKHPEIVERIKQEGHQVANHGMSHLNGWKVGVGRYKEDMQKGKELIGSDMFRPPYGRLGYLQYLSLKKTEKIVFWDVISGDFDSSIDGKRVADNVLNNIRNGSVVVMHDSAKAFKNVKTSLNEIIMQLSEKGYSFGTLEALIEPKID